MACRKTLYSLLDVKKKTGISYPTLIKYAREIDPVADEGVVISSVVHLTLDRLARRYFGKKPLSSSRA